MAGTDFRRLWHEATKYFYSPKTGCQSVTSLDYPTNDGIHFTPG